MGGGGIGAAEAWVELERHGTIEGGYGEFGSPYRARWESDDQVGGTIYGETLESSLPVDQLPEPTR